MNYTIAFLAALAAGHAVFPVSNDIAETELNTASERSSAAAMIDSDLRVHRTGSARAGSPCHVGGGPALLLQSSGTMGLPKIVYRSAAAIDAVARNCAEAVGIEQDDQALVAVPLSHSYGLEHGVLAPIFAGATVHLVRGFDLQTILRELKQSKITLFPGVPSIYEMIGQLSDAGPLEHLRVAYSAGGAAAGIGV